jgi:hypothetical protein
VGSDNHPAGRQFSFGSLVKVNTKELSINKAVCTFVEACKSPRRSKFRRDYMVHGRERTGMGFVLFTLQQRLRMECSPELRTCVPKQVYAFFHPFSSPCKVAMFYASLTR